MEDIINDRYSLYNENCLKTMKTMGDETVDLIVTDPPYHCISGGKSIDENGNKRKGCPRGILYQNDGRLFDNNDIKAEDWMPELYRVLKNGSDCYIMTNLINLTDYLNLSKMCGFKLHNLLVWEKNNSTPSRWYMKNCEYILYLYKGKAKPINNPGSKTVHQSNNILGNKVHPTEKPVDLMEYYVLNSSKEGQVVLDPFMGAGSTGIASAMANRRFIGVELDEKYFAIAADRIKNACN